MAVIANLRVYLTSCRHLVVVDEVEQLTICLDMEKAYIQGPGQFQQHWGSGDATPLNQNRPK